VERNRNKGKPFKHRIEKKTVLTRLQVCTQENRQRAHMIAYYVLNCLLFKKKKKLNGLLKATEENQGYASALNHGVTENLKDIIILNKRARENTEEM